VPKLKFYTKILLRNQGDREAALLTRRTSQIRVLPRHQLVASVLLVHPFWIQALIKRLISRVHDIRKSSWPPRQCSKEIVRVQATLHARPSVAAMTHQDILLWLANAD